MITIKQSDEFIGRLQEIDIVGHLIACRSTIHALSNIGQRLGKRVQQLETQLDNAALRDSAYAANDVKIHSELQDAHQQIERLEAQLAEREWISVQDRLPEDETHCLVFTPDESGEVGPRIDFEYWEDDHWFGHTEHYDHFIAVGGHSLGGDDCEVIGPSEAAPYTHWMPLPEPPKGEG